MNATIQKWGNSQGVRIPKIFLDQLGFCENEKVEIIANEDSIILKKADKPKHLTIEQRLEAFYGVTVDKIKSVDQIEELDWGRPLGGEIW